MPGSIEGVPEVSHGRHSGETRTIARLCGPGEVRATTVAKCRRRKGGQSDSGHECKVEQKLSGWLETGHGQGIGTRGSHGPTHRSRFSKPGRSVRQCTTAEMPTTRRGLARPVR